MARPIVTLTTDFGLTDYFTAAMKGVILSLCPQAVIIDVSHGVRPFDVMEAAFLVSQAWRTFPKKSVHVAVVDPGVGSDRRPLLGESNGHYFIGPDNGIFSLVFDDKSKVREITNAELFHHPVSRTFHGRDIFAPAAAHLMAKAVTPAQCGRLIQDYLKPFQPRPTRISKRAWSGQVIRADHFGNLITNFHISEFEEIQTRPFEFAVGMEKIHRLALNYTDAASGEPVVLVGSAGYLEVAVNQGDAARQLGCGAGAPADLTLY
jgi:S-adenosylmethionine hydrolase